MKSIAYLLLLFGIIACQSNELDTQLGEFIIKDDFKIQEVAAEPLLDSPVAMTQDLKGRLWVVELPGYMRDINASDENKADGKIIILEDEDGDGTMDKRKVFLDGLVAPRALALVYGGLLYTETPKLWWTPIENDQPGERVLVDSVYVIGGNIEHQSNGLLYNLDNWIYSAKSNARYQRKNGKWIKEITNYRGQWGIAHDDEGRLYYNNNSTPIVTDFLGPNQLIANPYLKPRHGANITLDKKRVVHPYQPVPVNRGYNSGVLDSLGKLKTTTSACAPMVYRGDQFPESFHGNGFFCAPEVNLIKRYQLHEEEGQIISTPVYENSEFLVSTDFTFRPVNLYNALDGTMYIVDLRKGIIQHRAYMSNYLREKSIEYGLDTINGIGRIYKIYSPSKAIAKPEDYSQYTNADFVKTTPTFKRPPSIYSSTAIDI